MATSPREELVITAIVVFGRFGDEWVWSEQDAQSHVVVDSGTRSFVNVYEAVADFFADEGIDLGHPVDPTDAHYSELIRITPQDMPAQEFHIRKYKYGAPVPIQATT